MPIKVGQGERTPKRRPKVSKAVSEVLAHEPKNTASHEALSKQAKRAAALRTAEERSAVAKKAAQTKGFHGRKEAAQKAAKTRARLAHGQLSSQQHEIEKEEIKENTPVKSQVADPQPNVGP
ncbi:MAG: hypothetical protein WBO09_20460 [Methylocystis silviterrae]|uniref:hypothetical protein n=1 Tax=Methylocystis silviterrae TaxID=2743612 RepID=UPI003C796CCB